MEKMGFVRQGVVRLPPGFRFHPTDEELVLQYLHKKVFRCPLPAAIIPEIELPRYDPWDLPGSPDVERYFFNFRQAKYPNGSRPNRASASGYWKATGKDRQIVASRSNQVVGMKKVLVFYRGKAPNGSKTDWIMHEYRLAGAAAQACILSQRKNPTHGSLVHMEEWVLCRIFRKRRAIGNGHGMEEDCEEEVGNWRRRFIDIMGQADADSTGSSDLEPSCVTEEASDGCSSGDDDSCTSGPSFPSRRQP
ncbi:hypothetical protein Taro_040555 [Colocasia esculenta]|uniref:NAC domain-containing protein n=1 Tax=Colocasia esculenta TaxID=4460 RepID=A0A843WDI0_COLES|nr:hypothetical protein [Colocasia esculenta]